jgi:chorismate synthase
MAGNTIGNLFRLTTFGESHGKAIGGIIDGCPAGVALDLEAIQHELDRRKPGQSSLTSPRKESDTVQWLSGIYEGITLGTPIGFLIPNEDVRSEDYDHLKNVYRPSHADATWDAKFGLRDHRGGGRSSARETACRVVAGGVARQVLAKKGIAVWAYVQSVGEIELQKPYTQLLRQDVDRHLTRCPDGDTADAMQKLIEKMRNAGDSIGGAIQCIATGVPAGLGGPVFDKLNADLAKAMMSINAVKAVEIGSGVDAAKMRGSAHNDAYDETGKRISNHAGGILGGISSGDDVLVKVSFKPVATIMQDQQGLDKDGKAVTISGKGRHDPCVVPRAVPIVEAMCLLTIIDHYLLQQAYK